MIPYHYTTTLPNALPFIDDEEIAMASQEDLDYIGLKIIEILREQFPNDEGYVQSKIDRLVQMPNKFETFSWALCQLDSDNIFKLFEKLGLDRNGYNFYCHLFKCL